MFDERDFNPLHLRRVHLSRNHAYALVTVFGLTAAGIAAVVGIKSLQGETDQDQNNPRGVRVTAINDELGEQVLVVVPTATTSSTPEPPTATPTPVNLLGPRLQ